jgi:galactokinase/galacturonokinase
VDHQHGLVTGFAIDKGVDLRFDVREDSKVVLDSETFTGHVEFDIATPALVKQGDWGDYARGAKFALQKRFKLKTGIVGTIKGSIPVGGLSSSAAVLIAYVMAFAKANGIQLEAFEVMKIASEAEREYIGLNNGLLDQACIALGKKDYLLMLDCESNEYRLIPFGGQRESVKGQRSDDEGLPFEFGIFFSGLTRSLMSSDYNLRVAECKTATWLVQAYENIPLKEQNKTFLRDVSENMYKIHRDKMPPRFARRAEHFFSEHKRVREGITAWETGNLEWFGSLSKASCESSIHNYECGSPELIAIYNAMLTTDGIYGGRFSGAGFKGACIALVDPSKKESIEKEITEKYLAQFPQYKNSFKVYFCKSDDGARFVEE